MRVCWGWGDGFRAIYGGVLAVIWTRRTHPTRVPYWGVMGFARFMAEFLRRYGSAAPILQGCLIGVRWVSRDLWRGSCSDMDALHPSYKVRQGAVRRMGGARHAAQKKPGVHRAQPITRSRHHSSSIPNSRNFRVMVFRPIPNRDAASTRRPRLASRALCSRIFSN